MLMELTDASFKTYAPPLEPPYDKEIRAGLGTHGCERQEQRQQDKHS